MKVTPTQAHWFRLRRSGLVDRFPTPEDTARSLIGVQAQLPPAADLAFWNRTVDCTRDSLAEARLDQRSLVRFWGQRNTENIFATEDWPFLHTLFSERQSITQQRLEKAGLIGEFRRLVGRTRKRLEEGQQLTYKDIKSKKLEEGQDHWVISYLTFRELVRQGVTCHGPNRGNESTFVHREHWLESGSDWSPPTREEAFAELALRYLSAYGPAEARDLAFWYGSSLTNAKRWLASAGERCSSVEMRDRALYCCVRDLDQLAEKPPPPSRWPVRLLYRFDPLLLATKDKSWLIDEEHYKKVWRPAAHVEAVVLARGRIAGTWRYDRKARGTEIRIRPFTKLSQPVSRSIEREAKGIARFFDLELSKLEVATG